MKLSDFVVHMERIAPPELALGFDNVGLLLGTDRTEIKKVLVALDCTVETAKEAVEYGADLLLTHHPLFFEPVRRILPDTEATAAAYILLRNGIAMYAAHTNLDAAEGGVNDVLAETLCIGDVAPLPPENLGRIGTLERETSLEVFAEFVSNVLNTTVRIAGERESMVRKVALIGGAGGGDVAAAKEAGADAFVTGEIKHHQAIEAKRIGLAVIEAGHYETEQVILEKLIKHLQMIDSEVQYKLAQFDCSPLVGL